VFKSFDEVLRLIGPLLEDLVKGRPQINLFLLLNLDFKMASEIKKLTLNLISSDNIMKDKKN
jgi:hypothetical protein